MRKKVSVLVLEQDGYQETGYQGSQAIASPIFPELTLTPNDLLIA